MAVFKCASLKDPTQFCSRSPDQRFEADPDIAGIGVIVGFLTTTGLALLVAFAVLFLDHFDRIVTFFRKTFTENKEIYQHPAETTSSRSPKFWSFVLAKNLLSLADTQILTGLAIQFTALLRHCKLTFYHWGIVTDLALLTTVTHLLTVVVLRNYFVRNKWINLPRILSMLGNLAFLGYTQYTFYSSEAGGLVYSNLLACYFRQPDKPGLRNIGGGRVTLLASAILSHVAVIFAMYMENTKQSSTDEHDEPKRATIWSRILRIGAIFRTWIIAPAYAIIGVYTAGSGLRTTQAMGNKSITERMNGSESNWGFGQYLPVLLVALPIFAGWESYWEEKDPDRTNRFRSSDQNSRAGSQALLDRLPGQPLSKTQLRSRDPSVEEKRVESSPRHRFASRRSVDPGDNRRGRPGSQMSISPLPTPAIPSPLHTPPLPTASPHLSIPSPAMSPQISSLERSRSTLGGGSSPPQFGER